MTAGEFSQVDLDLLADYVGGALAGTPEESIVAARIAEDPAWAQAHAALTPAVEAVRNRLANWASAEDTMPADVAARLDDVLAELSAAGHAATAATTADGMDEKGPTAHVPQQPRRPLPLPLGSAAHPSGRDTRAAATSGRGPRTTNGTAAARRRIRWAVPVGVAAAALAFAGFGLNHIVDDGSGAGPRAAQAPAGPAPAAARSGSTVHPLLAGPTIRRITSGIDYSPATLPQALATLATAAPNATTSHRTPSGSSTQVPASLRRLTDAGALDACIQAVTAGQELGQAVTVEFVDYARFNGKPALVLSFTDVSGDRWAWVTGPGCGTAESGPDVRYRARVG